MMDRFKKEEKELKVNLQQKEGMNKKGGRSKKEKQKSSENDQMRRRGGGIQICLHRRNRRCHEHV